jgi:hypothetical protein
MSSSRAAASNPFWKELGGLVARAYMIVILSTGDASGFLVTVDNRQHAWPTNCLIDRADSHTETLNQEHRQRAECQLLQP